MNRQLMHILTLCLGLIVCLPLATLAQVDLGRKLFSNGGGAGAAGIQQYNYSFGESLVGTANANFPMLTKGFQQPEPDYLLAISLAWLDLEALPQGNVLSWQTSQEEVGDRFLIERSHDGTTFIPAHQIASSQIGVYQWTDPEAMRSAEVFWYYRIQQIQANGRVVYSDIRHLRLQPTASRWSFFPNPAQGHIWLKGEAATQGMLRYQVWDFQGKMVLPEGRAAVEASFEIQIPLAGLSEGAYLVRAFWPGGQAQASILVQP
ncbi:MAG: T9SS type A sorting domain-containing protein [Bacteroidota bacterium]